MCLGALSLSDGTSPPEMLDEVTFRTERNQADQCLEVSDVVVLPTFVALNWPLVSATSTNLTAVLCRGKHRLSEPIPITPG